MFKEPNMTIEFIHVHPPGFAMPSARDIEMAEGILQALPANFDLYFSIYVFNGLEKGALNYTEICLCNFEIDAKNGKLKFIYNVNKNVVTDIMMALPETVSLYNLSHTTG